MKQTKLNHQPQQKSANNCTDDMEFLIFDLAETASKKENYALADTVANLLSIFDLNAECPASWRNICKN